MIIHLQNYCVFQYFWFLRISLEYSETIANRQNIRLFNFLTYLNSYYLANHPSNNYSINYIMITSFHSIFSIFSGNFLGTLIFFRSENPNYYYYLFNFSLSLLYFLSTQDPCHIILTKGINNRGGQLWNLNELGTLPFKAMIISSIFHFIWKKMKRVI